MNALIYFLNCVYHVNLSHGEKDYIFLLLYSVYCLNSVKSALLSIVTVHLQSSILSILTSKEYNYCLY